MSWQNLAGPGDAADWQWVDDGQGDPQSIPGDTTSLPNLTSPPSMNTLDTSGDGGLITGATTGSSMWDTIQNALGGGGGGSTLSNLFGGLLNPNVMLALSSIIPGMKMADQMNKNADTYMNKGESYARLLDPFGSQRPQYQSQLSALEADPSKIVDTPGYKFSLSQGLGAIAGRDNSRFGLGAGRTSQDMMDYAEGLASKTYNDTISQLSNLSGAQFGPQGSSVLGLGLQGSLNSKIAALNAKFSPLGILNAPLPNRGTTINNNTTTTTGGGPAGTVNPGGHINLPTGTTPYVPGSGGSLTPGQPITPIAPNPPMTPMNPPVTIDDPTPPVFGGDGGGIPD